MFKKMWGRQKTFFPDYIKILSRNEPIVKPLPEYYYLIYILFSVTTRDLFQINALTVEKKNNRPAFVGSENFYVHFIQSVNRLSVRVCKNIVYSA